MARASGPMLPPAAMLQRGQCQQIARYLNEAIALQPLLRVEGQPPQLRIYLLPVHLAALAEVLPQLESALESLPGTKFWDVNVYVDEGPAQAARLIHHVLVERTATPQAAGLALRPSRPAGTPRNTRLATRTKRAAAAPLSQLVTLRSRVTHRRRAARRRRLVASLVGISLFSFALGSLVGGIGAQRSPTLSTTPRTPLAGPTVASHSNSETPHSRAESTQSAAAVGHLPESPPTATVPEIDRTLLLPLTSVGSLSAAANLLTVPPSAQVAVSLKAVGDIIPGTNFPNYRLPQDPNYLFNSVRMFLGEVDLVFGNFESTLTDYPYSAKDISQGMTFAFRTPPAFADVLRSAGFDILSVANNHSFDFGDPGFADTISFIEQAGMRAVGRKDDIVIVEANGYAIAFIGFSYWSDHNYMNDLETAANLVRTAQAQADMVVISVHAGAEGTDALSVKNQTEYFFSENRGNMVQFSRAMVDAGADLILGHGPHVPRAIELYQNKLIAYSLGNFLGYRTLSTDGPLGNSLILQVDLNETGDFVHGRVIPVALDPNGVPYIDNFFESVTLVRQLTMQDFPNTPLEIDQVGYILKKAID